MKLHMSEDEIIAEYRQAKEPEAQIKILADENCTTEKVIREILERHGATTPLLREHQILEDNMRELYEKGRNDNEIGAALSINPKYVKEWRRKNNLHGNHGSRSPKTRKEVPPVPPAPDSSSDILSPKAVELAPDTLKGLEVYAIVETILSAIPPESGAAVKATAADLTMKLMDEYINRRLGIVVEEDSAI